MNWKIIFQLSLLGLIMAIGTVWLIPQMIEPLFWLVIFIFSAYVIAKTCSSKYFLHGFMLSLFNCVWIIAAHALFYSAYIAHHPDMSPDKMHVPAALSTHPRLILIGTGPIVGAICGLVQGLFAFIASKIVKKPATPAEA